MYRKSLNPWLSWLVKKLLSENIIFQKKIIPNFELKYYHRSEKCVYQ